jgi:hypothetical protein
LDRLAFCGVEDSPWFAGVVLWSPIFGLRGRSIGLQEKGIECKLVCSNVRNLEEEIDCELAGWKGENTSESRNFPYSAAELRVVG